jgi:cytochrome bd ubiquinol oxidase subunit I
LNPAALAQVLHMMLAAYMAVGLAVAGIHARLLLMHPRRPLHRSALRVALLVGLVPALAQPLSGDFAGRVVARTQPAKLAAMEGHFETGAWAPLRLGGIPSVERRHTPYAIAIPGGLGVLAYGDPSATVIGLNDIPQENWPPVVVVHIAFQAMVAIGLWLAALALWAAWLAWRRRLLQSPPFLRALAISTPLGFIALEAGWIVTELGRQPWIIQGIMRTSEAVTPVPGLDVSLTIISTIYIGLAAIVAVLIRRQILQTQT